jgi:hypothetical protein
MLGLLEEPRNLNVESAGDLQERQLRKVGGCPKDVRKVMLTQKFLEEVLALRNLTVRIGPTSRESGSNF